MGPSVKLVSPIIDAVPTKKGRHFSSSSEKGQSWEGGRCPKVSIFWKILLWTFMKIFSKLM